MTETGSPDSTLQGRQGLYKMLQEGMFTDAVIIAKDLHFPVHKVILATASGYFRASLTTGEKFGSQSRINLPGVSGETMALLLNFIYLKQLPLTHQNVCQVFVVADYLVMDGVTKRCIKYIASNINSDNALSLLDFARKYSITLLLSAIRKYLLRHFSAIARTTAFREMEAGDVVELLQSNHLNVSNEEKVWEAVVSWMLYKPWREEKYLPILLKSIRLGLLSSDYFLHNVRDYPGVTNNQECLPTLNNALRFLFDLDVDDEAEYQQGVLDLASPRYPPEILFAVGGWSGGSPTSCIEAYDIRADHWTMILETDPMGPRAYHGTVVVENKMYIIGGYNGLEYYNSCRCFDVDNRVWKEIAPMNKSRCYVSVALCGKYIYAMGGFNGRMRQHTAERYDLDRNQWTMIADMHMARSDASADSINGKVYIVGGFNGQECLNTVEMYDPLLNEWRMLPPMASKRSGVSCVFFESHLYVLGGFNGVARMSTVEKYDTTTNRWTTGTDMLHSRSNFSVAVLDGCLIVVGGFNGIAVTSDAECYHPDTSEWLPVSALNVPRSALTACAFANLIDIEYFIRNRESVLQFWRLQGRFPAIADEAPQLNDAEPRENVAARASRLQRYRRRL